MHVIAHNRWIITMALLLASLVGHAANAEAPRKPYLSSEAAAAMVDACLAYAKENDFAIAIAVVDDGGHLLSFHRTHNLRYNVVDLTLRKAVSAYEAARPTRLLQDRFKEGDLGILALGQYPYAGGLPVFVGDHTVGGIATGGAGREREEKCAAVALQVLTDDEE